MKLLKMSKPQCLLYSAAMVLGREPQDLVAEIGHDGMEIVWNLPAPKCYRGHHIQEIVDVALAQGQGLVPIQAYPASGHAGQPPVPMIPDHDRAATRFLHHLNGRDAILIGASHACAWNGQEVFDPNGFKRALEDFSILEAWILI